MSYVSNHWKQNKKHVLAYYSIRFIIHSFPYFIMERNETEYERSNRNTDDLDGFVALLNMRRI